MNVPLFVLSSKNRQWHPFEKMTLIASAAKAFIPNWPFNSFLWSLSASIWTNRCQKSVPNTTILGAECLPNHRKVTAPEDTEELPEGGTVSWVMDRERRRPPGGQDEMVVNFDFQCRCQAKSALARTLSTPPTDSNQATQQHIQQLQEQVRKLQEQVNRSQQGKSAFEQFAQVLSLADGLDCNCSGASTPWMGWPSGVIGNINGGGGFPPRGSSGVPLNGGGQFGGGVMPRMPPMGGGFGTGQPFGGIGQTFGGGQMYGPMGLKRI